MADYKQFKNKSVIEALTTGNVALGSVANVRITGGSSGQFVTTDGAGNLSFATPASAGTITATATGTLSDGTKVIVNSDGTVSAIAATAESLSSQTQPSAFYTADSIICSAYDPTTGKILIALCRTSPIFYIGTITNGSLTLDFGYSLSGISDSYSQKLIYISSNKFFFYYTNSSGYLIGYILTISGTTVTAGTGVTLVSSSVQNLSAAYDTYNQRLVITYTKSYVPYHIIGSISGSTLSVGSEFPILASGSTVVASRVVFNQAARTMVFIWTTGTSTQYGLSTSIPVPTSTNTSSSWQTPANIYKTWFYTEGGGTYNVSDNFQVSYNVAAKKIVIVCYQKNSVGAWIVHGDGINWSLPLSIPSTTSGNNNTPYLALSYCNKTTATTAVFSDTGYNGFYYFTLSFDSVNPEIVTTGTVNYFGITPYRLSVVSANNGQTLLLYGASTVTAQIWQLASTTLTSTNYIGISNAAYTNGQTATIQTAGSVDDAQTGLTAGSAYYVQNNGALSTTPGIPNVFAGTATASTKILIKG